MELFDNLQNFIEPELMIIVPVLYLLGNWLKNNERFADEKIPFYLGATGVALAILYVLSTAALGGVQDILHALFSAITQGVACAGTAVYVNQLKKQAQRMQALESTPETQSS